MTPYLYVLLAIVPPFILMFCGVIKLVKSRNNETTKGMVIGVILTLIGGATLITVAIFLVHELVKYAPYFALS